MGAKTPFIRSHNLEDICFAVEQVASDTLFPGFEFVQDKEKVIYLPATKRVLHFCSEGYRLVPNQQLILPIRDALTARYGSDAFDVRIQYFDDRKFYVSFVLSVLALNAAPGDFVHPTLEIRNSYDGSLKFSMMRGFFRRRGESHLMAFDQVIAGEKKHSHRAGPRPSVRAIDELEKSHSALSLFRELNSVPLEPATVTSWAGLIAAKTAYPRRLVTDAAHHLYAESEAYAVGLSAWLLYCAFNAVLNRADISMHPEFRARIDGDVLNLIRKEAARL